VRRFAALTTLAGAVAASGTALADGGYYGGALGARAAGRAGAFVARADDPTAVHYNPAGLATIGGTVVMLGNRFSHNGYSYTRAPTLDWGNASGGVAPMVTFDKVSNGKPWQALEPLIAVASNLGLPDFGFALAAFAAPGASNLTFPPGGGQRYMMLAREAIILNYTASAAWKWRDVFGIGATLEWISVPRLDYSLIIEGSPFVQDVHPVSGPLDMVASTKGKDWFTFNAILGAWVRPVPFLQIGVAGQVVPTSIETNSTLDVTPVNMDPNMPVDPVELRRDGRPANDVSVILPLPLMARAGVRYIGGLGGRHPWDVELDAEYETWSRVNQFTVDTRRLTATFQGADVALDKITIAKNWRDTVAVKLGGDVMVVPGTLALRGGAFYETAVAPSAYANVDFAGGAMAGGTVGGSYVTGRWEVVLAYQLRQQLAVNVTEANARVYQQAPASGCVAPYTDPNFCHPAYIGTPGPVINAGSYQARFHHLSLALLYRY
jgi:long-subunit fatty acid transport protein